MDKKTLVAASGVLILAASIIYLAGKSNLNQQNQPQSATLFYGNTCPHCKKVEDFLKENPQIQKNSNLILKEVYENKKNKQEMVRKALECNLDVGKGIGVPFLYDKGKCIIGDKPVIDYLNENYQ